MLLGFPLDYQEEDFIQEAIDAFGKLIYWQKDSSYKTRVLVKARVLDLQSVPPFIVFTESLMHESDGWTIQCEVLQSNLLGGGPQDEDHVPDLPVGNGAPFAFYGFGKLGVGPPQQVVEDQQQGNQWDEWLQQLEQHNQQNPHNQQIQQEPGQQGQMVGEQQEQGVRGQMIFLPNLNNQLNQPIGMEIDLNQEQQQEDH